MVKTFFAVLVVLFFLIGGVSDAQVSSPTVTLTAPVAGEMLSGQVLITASATSNSSTVAGVQFFVDSVVVGVEDRVAPYAVTWDTRSIANGVHRVTAEARDLVGNRTVSSPISVTVQNAGSVKFTVGSTVTTISGVYVRESPSVRALGLAIILRGSRGAVTGGPLFVNNYWWWKVRYDSGLEGWSAENYLSKVTSVGVPLLTNVTASVATGYVRVMWVTDTPSNTQIEYGSTSAYGKTTLLNQSLLTNHSVTIPFLQLSPNTTYHYRAISKNALRVQGMSDDLTFTTPTSTDRVPPSVSITTPSASAAVSESTSLQAQAFDETKLAGVQFFVDSVVVGVEDRVAPYAVTWDTRSIANGVHRVTAEARDLVGNRTVSSPISVTVQNAGSVKFTVGSTVTTISGVYVRESPSVRALGLAIILRGSRGAVTGGPLFVNNYWWWKVRYDSGLEGWSAENYLSPTSGTLGLPDTIFPIVSISSPSVNASVLGSITVTANASDNVGVIGVQFKLDGTNIGTEDATAPYSVTWNTATATNGTHAITAVARDAAGNTKTSTAVAVTISNTSVIPPPPSASSSFVTVQNSKFYLSGTPFYFGANNAYWLMDQQAITFEGGGTVSQVVLHQLDRSRDIGIKVIRLWGFNEDANRQATLQTSPGVYKETTFKALDFVINEAGKRGIKLIISLVNHQAEYGGVRKYVEWAGLTNIGEFYTNPQVKQLFKNHISVMLNRTNTYTGTKYKDDPTVMAWEIINEASNTVTGVNNVDPTALRDFYTEFARYIKSIDTKHLVTTGEEGFDHSTYTSRYSTYANNWVHRANERGTSYYLNTNIPEIDFAQVHFYPAAWAMQPGTESINWFKEHASIATAAGKPLIIGEYGISDHSQYTAWLTTVEQENAIGGAFLWQYGASGVPWYYMQNNGMQIREGDADENIIIDHNARMSTKTGTTSGGGTPPPPPADTTNPSVSITSPTVSTTVLGSITVTANASDNVGVIGVQFKLDGTNIGTEDATAPYSVTWNTATATNGTHAITAVARDAAGNTKNSASVTVNISNAVLPPSGTLKIMPLGDSITELDWQGGYRGYLYKKLNDDGVSFDYVGTKNNNHADGNLGFSFPQAYWDHEGYGSATITSNCGSTWVWNTNIASKLAANSPDIVLILLGTNDLNSNSWNPTQCSPTAVRNSMSSFMDQIWTYNPNIKIVLGSPPQASGSTLNAAVSQYTALIPALISEKVTLGRKIVFANHNAVMNSIAGGDLVGDGIHPSPAGYLKMSQVWFDAIKSIESGNVIMPPSTKFVIGNRVQVTSEVNVRSTPSASGTLLGSQLIGSQGVVIGGPIAASGYVWWQINYDNGSDGWSIENNLI